MRPAQWILLMLAAVAPGAALAQSGSVGSLEQQLRGMYPVGRVFVVQQVGMEGAAGCNLIPQAEFKEGQLHKPSSLQEFALGSAKCISRKFPIGWKVILAGMTVNPKTSKIEMGFVECDACNRPANSMSFLARLQFQFAKGALETTDPSEAVQAISQVLGPFNPGQTVPPTAPPPAAYAPPPQQPPAATPPPAPSGPAPVYVSARDSADRLLLNPDGSLLLMKGGSTFTGEYTVNGSHVKARIGVPPQDVDMTLSGTQLVMNGDEVWVQPGQAPDTPTVRKGDTTDQVRSKLGAPSDVIDLGSKVVYVYKNLKITFLDGRVSDVQ